MSPTRARAVTNITLYQIRSLRRIRRRRLLRQALQQVAEQIGTVDAFCFPLKIQYESMAQTRDCNRADVLEADVKAAIKQRPHLAGEHQALSPTRAGAVTNIALYQIRSLRRLWMRRQHTAHSIILHVRSDRNLTHEALGFQNALHTQNRLQSGLLPLRGPINNLAQVLKRRI